MTDLLKRAVARVEQLPTDRQDAIAEVIERELEEQEWDALVSRPSSQRFLTWLVSDAERAEAAGDLRDIELDQDP